MVLINIAFTKGYAGPCAALASIQTVIHTALNAIFYKEIPNAYEISGMIIGMTGTMIIYLGPQIWGLIFKTVPAGSMTPEERLLSETEIANS